jgi:hypothetical protein
MKTYIIVLQLNAPEASYVNLTNYLQTASYWARPYAFTWLIKATIDAAKLRDGVRERIAPNDKVIIMAIANNDWGSYNIPKEVTDWMKNNL